MIKGVTYVGIPVKDHDIALEFYTEKMGFKIATDRLLSDRQRWVEVLIPGSATRLALIAPTEERGRRTVDHHSISLGCDDVFATCKVLRLKGVLIVQEPRKESWGSTAVVADSDGNALVLSSRGRPKKVLTKNRSET